MLIFKWVLVLPVAILSPLVLITGLKVAMLILGFADWRWAFSNESSPLVLMVEYALFAAVFVLAGVFTAPSNKRTAAVLLASVFYLYFFAQGFVILLFPEMIEGWFPIVYGFSSVIAASLATRAVFRDENLSFLRHFGQ